MAKVYPMTENGRYICTKDLPMELGASGRWCHPDAREIESTCNCCARYQCPHCKEIWLEELPQ